MLEDHDKRVLVSLFVWTDIVVTTPRPIQTGRLQGQMEPLRMVMDPIDHVFQGPILSVRRGKHLDDT